MPLDPGELYRQIQVFFISLKSLCIFPDCTFQRAVRCTSSWRRTRSRIWPIPQDIWSRRRDRTCSWWRRFPLHTRHPRRSWETLERIYPRARLQTTNWSITLRWGRWGLGYNTLPQMFIDLQTREDSFWEDVVLKTRRPKDIRLEGKQHYPSSAPSHTSGSWTVLEDQTTEFSCTLSLFIKRFFVKTNSYSVKPLRRIFCKTNNLFNRDCVCYYVGYLVAPSSVDVWSLVEKAGFRCLGLLRISKVLGSLWLVLTVKHHSMFQLFVIWRCSCRHWIICQHGFTRAFFSPLCFLIWNQLNLNGRVGQSWSQTCLAHSSAALTWWVMVPKCGWSPRTWKHLYRCYAE